MASSMAYHHLLPMSNTIPMVQEYRELHSLLVDGGQNFGVTTVTFDRQEELVWMGNGGGHVTSYYGARFDKYTSFQVHNTNEIRQILPIEAGVLSLTSNYLKLSHRRGLVITDFTSDHMNDMQCILEFGEGKLLMGGHQDNLVTLDLETRHIEAIPITESSCAILRHHPRFICSGDTSGKVCLRDPKTLITEFTLDAHTGCLSDFDVSGNQLVTAGFSNRMGNLTLDRFLKVYDLRTMRAMPPLQLMFDPLLLRFMPTFTSRLAVCSQGGQFQLIESDRCMTSQMMPTYQVNTGATACLSFDCSTTCQALTFGDAGGYLHLFGTNNNISFNPFSKDTEFADPVQEINPIHINDEITNYSTIPLPVSQSGRQLSDWPEEFLQVRYRSSVPINQDIIKSMRLVQSIGYAPKPPQMMCNQVPYKLSNSDDIVQRRTRQLSSSEQQNSRDTNAIIIPKRYVKVEVKYTKMGYNDFDFNRYNKTCFSGMEAGLPNAYCNCMLQVMFYTEPIRRTMLNHLCSLTFCLSCELGLLFHMLENSQGLPCQASNFLRTFRSLPEAAALGLVLPDEAEALRKNINLRRLIQSWNRFILSQLHSELMRPQQLDEKAETHSEDEADINDSDDLGPGHVTRRRYNSGEKTESRQAGSKAHPKSSRYCKSSNNYKYEETTISKMFGTQTITQNVCKCGAEYLHNSESFLCFLTYPEKLSNSENESNIPLMSFPELLQKSFSAEKIMQAWCETCKKYQTTVQTKLLRKIPDVLAVHCGLETNSNLEFWKAQVEARQAEMVSDEKLSIKPCRYGNGCTRQDCKFWHEDLRKAGQSSEDAIPAKAPIVQHPSSWLPAYIKIKLDENGTAVVKECTSEESESRSADLDEGFVLYELTSAVSHVVDNRSKGKDNLVSCIKVGAGYHQRTGALVSSDLTQWYLFNDFSVYPVAPEEAVWLSLDWKIPCFLYYCRKDLNFRNNVEIKSPFTSAVFDDDKSLAAKASQKVTFTPLTPDERPSEGELIAMDAEFVTINQEEALLRSDGTRSTIKPCQMSVARITCIRGEGEMEGVPFIDDYISTQEQVVDYLTKFSGIRPGDLDVSISSKHLTTLKSTYKKLRYLIDTKVHFVGHGLKNDFRVINLVIPPEQVHDTVLLFQLPNQRLVSLRFLAWHFLGLNIQSVTHDSIEDARTALKLYREYQRLEAAGQVKGALRELYETGRNLQWKVPDSNDIEQ